MPPASFSQDRALLGLLQAAASYSDLPCPVAVLCILIAYTFPSYALG
jgi:hypothetical protein